MTTMLELSLGLLVLVKDTLEAKDFGHILEGKKILGGKNTNPDFKIFDFYITARNLLPKLSLITVMAMRSALVS